MRNSGSCMDLEAAQGLHRRDAAAHQQPARNGGGGGRRRAHEGRLMGRARWLLSARWRLVALLLLALTLHSLTAKSTAPLFGSRGGIAGGVPVDGALPTGEGGQGGRARSLVEQPASPREGALTVLAAKAADLMAPLARVGAGAPPPPPPHEIPKEWLEGGTLGMWPKPYRNKTRQVMPNSVHEWKCSSEAANFTAATASSTPLLQSSEWRKRYGDEVSFFKWCREGLPEEVPQLQQVLKLESRKPRPAHAVTVVTQLSLERFQMLENQCTTWPHQISAVLYIPLLKGRIFSAEEPDWNKRSLDVGVAESIKFFQAMEASNTSCILDLEVVVEERCERYAAMLYPANAARNRALVNARTEAILLVDVDFAVSRSLADMVADEESYGRLMSMLHARNAVVLPAFETQDDGEAGKRVALEAVRQGKEYVVNKFQWNIVFGFHVPQYPQGHQPTDYWRWIKSHSAYPVKYEVGYEPYIMLHRDYTPFYDERFRGYYWNKVQHLMHISLQNGFNFLVHPSAFVVHVPHPKPSTKWLTRKMGQKEKNHILFDAALFHMRQMDFVPVTSFPQLCTKEAAPVLPGEDTMRQMAAQRLVEEQAASSTDPETKQQQLAASAAKRAAEAAAAAAWRAENPRAAAAAEKQKQDAALAADAEFIAAKQQQQAALEQAAALAQPADGAAAQPAADQGQQLTEQQGLQQAQQQQPSEQQTVQQAVQQDAQQVQQPAEQEARAADPEEAGLASVGDGEEPPEEEEEEGDGSGLEAAEEEESAAEDEEQPAEEEEEAEADEGDVDGGEAAEEEDEQQQVAAAGAQQAAEQGAEAVAEAQPVQVRTAVDAAAQSEAEQAQPAAGGTQPAVQQPAAQQAAVPAPPVAQAQAAVQEMQPAVQDQATAQQPAAAQVQAAEQQQAQPAAQAQLAVQQPAQPVAQEQQPGAQQVAAAQQPVAQEQQPVAQPAARQQEEAVGHGAAALQQQLAAADQAARLAVATPDAAQQPATNTQQPTSSAPQQQQATGTQQVEAAAVQQGVGAATATAEQAAAAAQPAAAAGAGAAAPGATTPAAAAQEQQQLLQQQ